jgi:hypothetical protein
MEKYTRVKIKLDLVKGCVNCFKRIKCLGLTNQTSTAIVLPFTEGSTTSSKAK